MRDPKQSPCSSPGYGEYEPCDRHEREQAHGEGEHALCDARSVPVCVLQDLAAGWREAASAADASSSPPLAVALAEGRREAADELTRVIEEAGQ